MEKKIALLESLNKAYFKVADENSDDVYFLGEEGINKTDFDLEKYEEYLELCNNGDDQTHQIQIPFEEWREENEESFYDWCDANLENVDDEIVAEMHEGNPTHYYTFEGKRYLICVEEEIKPHYDERCLEIINEFHVEVETKRNSWLRGFCENHTENLIKWFQRDRENQESNVLVQDGKLYGYEQVNETYYTIFEQ
jgi:hypothetical protein